MEVVGDELGRERLEETVHIGLERDDIRRSPDVGKERSRRKPPTLASVDRDVQEHITAPAVIGDELSPREDIERPLIQKGDWGEGVGKGGVRDLCGPPHLLTGPGVKRRELTVCSADVDQTVSGHQMAATHRGLNTPHPLPSGRIYGDERVIGSECVS